LVQTHGVFQPIGGAINADGELEFVGFTPDIPLGPIAILEYMREALAKLASERSLRAVGICYGFGGESVNGRLHSAKLAIEVDHRESGAHGIEVALSELENGTLELGAPVPFEITPFDFGGDA